MNRRKKKRIAFKFWTAVPSVAQRFRFYFTIRFISFCDDSFTRGQTPISMTGHWRILSYTYVHTARLSNIKINAEKFLLLLKIILKYLFNILIIYILYLWLTHIWEPVFISRQNTCIVCSNKSKQKTADLAAPSVTDPIKRSGRRDK